MNTSRIPATRNPQLKVPEEHEIVSAPLTPELVTRIRETIEEFEQVVVDGPAGLIVVGRASGGLSPALNSRQGADLLLALAEMLGEG